MSQAPDTAPAVPLASRTFPRPPSPCRYCGERDWLWFLPEYAYDHYRHEADGSLVLDSDGTPALFVVDHVECGICGAIAPEHVWNGEPVTPAMRAALVASYTADGYGPEARGLEDRPTGWKLTPAEVATLGYLLHGGDAYWLIDQAVRGQATDRPLERTAEEARRFYAAGNYFARLTTGKHTSAVYRSAVSAYLLSRRHEIAAKLNETARMIGCAVVDLRRERIPFEAPRDPVADLGLPVQALEGGQ